MPVKHTSRILWISLVLGLCFDLLFWKKPEGISFFLFILLVTAAGFVLAYFEGVKPGKLSWLLAGFSIVFSAMTFIRQEPFTNFINVLVSLACLALLALTFSNGMWIKYSLADTVVGFFRLSGAALGGGSSLLASSRKNDINPEGEVPTPPLHRRISFWAIFRGLLLAFPIVFFLALLLVSADPVFSKELEKILDIERFIEYAVRLALVAIIAYLLSGVYQYSLEKSGRDDLIGREKPWFQPFLGFTESTIVLAGVNLLFTFFVIIQFKYFFGGQANIQIDGFTYAEYARKGFGELVWVAILSLMLFLGLSTVTRRDSALKQRWFSGMSLALVCLVGVILVSSFMRLNLLESAYGFTRLRAYSHVFMIWLGVLLVAVLILEIKRYRRGFAMAAFFTLIGFGLTLNVMNVDGFIAGANAARAEKILDLDYQYLQELSTDSVPPTLEAFRDTKEPQVKHLLGAALACRASILETQLENWRWQGYHVSFNNALYALRDARPELTDYRVKKIEGQEDAWRTFTVQTPIGEKDCFKSYYPMD